MNKSSGIFFFFFWKKKEPPESSRMQGLSVETHTFPRTPLGHLLLIWDTALRVSGQDLHACWLSSPCLHFITGRIRADPGSGDGDGKLEPISSECMGGCLAQGVGRLWTREKYWGFSVGVGSHGEVLRLCSYSLGGEDHGLQMGSMYAGVYVCVSGAFTCVHAHAYLYTHTCVCEKEAVWISSQLLK